MVDSVGSAGSAADDVVVRLKCYLHSTIRVVRVPAALSEAELLARIRRAFGDARLRLWQYEDDEAERVTVGPDFWGPAGDALFVYRQTGALKVFLSTGGDPTDDPTVVAAPQPVVATSGRREIVASGTSDSVSPVLGPGGEAPPLRTPPRSPPSPLSLAGSPPALRTPPLVSGDFVVAVEDGSEEGGGGSFVSEPTFVEQQLQQQQLAAEEAAQPQLLAAAAEPTRATSLGAKQALARLQKRLSAPQRWARGQRLGKGGFGTVFMGVNTDTGDVFAVKQQELDEGDDERARKLLRQYDQEIQLMKSLDHANVVKYLGATIEGEQPQTLNIFMEYVGGGSLSGNLAKLGPFSESMVRVYGRQILAGIAYLHSCSIMHRDIKCSNILLDTSAGGKAVLKLTDFGCSRKIADSLANAQALSVKGTPFWMAPEVVSGDGYDNSADIWSFGCTLIEMATAKPPWSTRFPEASQALYQLRIGTEVEIPEEITSSGLRDVISLCLQRNPRSRPSATRLLAHPFFQQAAPPPVVDPSVSEPPRFTTPPPAVQINLGLIRPDILGLILAHADLADVGRCASVCRGWRDALRTTTFWDTIGHAHFNLPPPGDVVEPHGREAVAGCHNELRRWATLGLQHFALKGHERDVLACICTNDEGKTRIVSAGEDRRIKIWNAHKVHCSKTLKSHSGSVRCLAWASTSQAEAAKAGTVFASGSDDGTMRIWGIKTGRLLRTISRGAPVLQLASLGPRILSVCRNRDVVLSHDVETGAPVEALQDNALALTAAYALHADGPLVAAGVAGGHVHLWDVRMPHPVATQIAGHPGSATTALRLLSGSRMLVTGGADGIIRRWDLRNPATMAACDKLFSADGRRRPGAVTGLWLDSACVLSSGDDGVVRLWSVHEQSCAMDMLAAGSVPLGGLCCVDATLGTGHLPPLVCAGGKDRVVHFWSTGSGTGSPHSNSSSSRTSSSPPVSSPSQLRHSLATSAGVIGGSSAAAASSSSLSSSVPPSPSTPTLTSPVTTPRDTTSSGRPRSRIFNLPFGLFREKK